MESLDSLSLIVAVVGIGMLIISIVMYIWRTGVKSVVFKFWTSSSMLNRSELIINRLGLAIAIVGIVQPVFQNTN